MSKKMYITITEEEFRVLKAKAEMFDNQKKGHVELHYNYIHECMETAVYAGDEAIDHLNEILKLQETKTKFWIERFEALEKKIKNASCISLLLGNRPSRFDV